MTRKRYSEDFKKQIVELYNSGKTVLDIEREYDLHTSVIYGWIKRYNKSGSFKASENRTPYDNAVAETALKIIKTKFVRRQSFEHLDELRLEIATYIYGVDHKRIHSTLGYLSPVEYQQRLTSDFV